MTIGEKIDAIVKPHIKYHCGEQFITNFNITQDIKNLLENSDVPFKINRNFCQRRSNPLGVTEQDYFVFSWIEKEQLCTYSVLIESFI